MLLFAAGVRESQVRESCVLVLAQLTLAARWAAEPIAFSAPEYMTPWGGVAAGELGLDYLEWRAGRP